jgi:dienelactone hydrolase
VTFEDFADDPRAAVRYLSERGGIGTIGVMGHSEGGLVAPMAVNQSEAVDFAVCSARPD